MIFFLYGQNTRLSRKKLAELREGFISKIDRESSSVSTLDGATISFKDLQTALATGSLFVKKRLVIIENIFANRNAKLFSELLDYLKKHNSEQEDDNAIIFWAEELNTKNEPLKAGAKPLFTWLSQQKYVQEFKQLNNEQLIAYIKREFQANKQTISSGALQALSAASGNDLWRLDNDIHKLSNYFGAGQEVSLDAVKELTTDIIAENIFAFTDALSAKNKKQALRLFEEQLAAGLSEEYLLTMLVRQFKILLQIKDAQLNKLSAAQSAAQTKLHPFVVQKAWSAAGNFSERELKDYFNRLLEIDYKNKTGQGEIGTELSLLLAAL